MVQMSFFAPGEVQNQQYKQISIINKRAEMPNEANSVSLFAIIKFENKLVPVLSMVLILDGKSDIGEHVRSNLCN